MKCSGENVILRGIFHIHIISRFPLHFMLYRGNFDYFLDSVERGSGRSDMDSENAPVGGGGGMLS